MLPNIYLDLEDELKLYLVKNKLLQAAKIKISLDKEFSNCYEFYLEEFPVLGKENKNIFLKTISNDAVFKFESFLKTEGIHYSHTKLSKLDNVLILPPKTLLTSTKHYYISNNANSLDKLVSESLTPIHVMKLLGCPSPDALLYNHSVNNIVRDHNYFLVNLAMAKEKNISPPSWAAYLFFTPHTFDVINNIFSSSAKDLCLSHQDFVKNNSPYLAERVENSFLNEEYPFTWELRNEKYIIKYDFKHVNQIKQVNSLAKLN